MILVNRLRLFKNEQRDHRSQQEMESSQGMFVLVFLFVTFGLVLTDVDDVNAQVSGESSSGLTPALRSLFAYG